jgi:hypothetical protein
MKALVDQGVFRLEKQVLQQHRRTGVCEPSAHVDTSDLTFISGMRVHPEQLVLAFPTYWFGRHH